MASHLGLFCLPMSNKRTPGLYGLNILFRKQVLGIVEMLKDTDSTAPKRWSVFIGLMSPDGAILSRYKRAVLMR